MKRLLVASTFVFALAGANTAHAEICAKDVICASNPQGIVEAIQAMGYKATLDKDSSGDPKISSAASGYGYDIYFYDCNNHLNCSSIQFYVSFSKDSSNSEKLANEWNLKKRMGKMAFDPSDGSVSLQYDLSTSGGVNQANFKDVVGWWDSTLGALHQFFAEHPAK